MSTPTPDTEVPRLIIVDDTDPAIQYSIVFEQNSRGLLNRRGQGGPVYNSTITGTALNSSLSYKFMGTFVRAVLAVELEGEATNWNCTVDGQAIPSFQISDSQITNFIACDSGNMLSGTTDEHTLDVVFWFEEILTNVTMIWLDSIQYQPLPTALMSGVSVRIHNSDPSVTYNSIGAWEALEAAGLPAIPGDTGTNVSFALGSVLETASDLLVNFTFAAFSFTLYGVNFAQYGPSTASCYADSGPLFVDIDLPGMTSNISSTADISNFPLFGLGLISGQYNIGIITNVATTQYPEPLTISYFIITTDLFPTTNPNNTTPGSGSKSGSGLSAKHELVPIVVSIVTALLIAAMIIMIIWRKWLLKKLAALLPSRDSQEVGTPVETTNDCRESPPTGSDMISPIPYSSPPVDEAGSVVETTYDCGESPPTDPDISPAPYSPPVDGAGAFEETTYNFDKSPPTGLDMISATLYSPPADGVGDFAETTSDCGKSPPTGSEMTPPTSCSPPPYSPLPVDGAGHFVDATHNSGESPPAGADTSSFAPNSPPSVNRAGSFFTGATGFGIYGGQYTNNNHTVGDQITINNSTVVYMNSPTNKED